MIGRIKEWDNIFNLEFTNLIVTSRLYPLLLLIQIVWLLFIVHKIIYGLGWINEKRNHTIAYKRF